MTQEQVQSLELARSIISAAAEDRIAELEARNAALEADKRRLDCLENHQAEMAFTRLRESECSGDFWYLETLAADCRGKTIRDAIDDFTAKATK